MYKLKPDDVTDDDIRFTRNNANGYAFGKNTFKATDEQIKAIIVLNDTIAMHHNTILELQKQKDHLARQVKSQ